MGKLLGNVKKWLFHLRGDWISDLIVEIRSEGKKTRNHIDGVYDRAQHNQEASLDGEKYWLIPMERKRPHED